ncbi:hypothetical protein EPO34_00810 [Patescibacteria group bacterium]|nr:MAG: hypothetical protein EPO34_00810 [Patescibacteria group bacterium]
MLESHTKHASACGCLQACLSATVAHRIDETVRGNETGAARAFLAVVARSFVDIFARTIRQEESGFVQGVTGAYFHKEYAHVLLAVAVTAVDGDAKDPDDNDVN